MRSDRKRMGVILWALACARLLHADGLVLARPEYRPSGFAYFCNGGTVEIASSSHQDTAWMDTPDFCRRFRVEQNILPALEMMAKDPTYCFAMECTLHLMEFLEAHPERRDEVVRLMKAGRLEFGATYNQPYESYLSGEELVRQTYYGRRWIRKNLPGCDARVAFNPDVPGRALQMQQILAKAGIPYLFTSRYHEGLYRWISPDGSGILAYSPGHYCNPMALLKLPPLEAVAGIRAKLEEQGAYYQWRNIPPAYCLINSQDFSRPVDFGPLISAWNAQTNTAAALRPPAMSYGSIASFFGRVNDSKARFDTLSGERPDVWLYIHGPTHHLTTSLRREAARLLPAAETFSTFACLLDGSFTNYPAKALAQAWMDEIYIDHGIGGKNGHITDEVFHRKVASARDAGRASLDKALGTIAAQIRLEPKLGTPLTVFNTLAWSRSEPVVWDVPDNLTGPLRITDAEGHTVSSQVSTLGVPVDINVAAAAAGAKATASSVYGPDYGAEKAIDGRWAVRDRDPALGGSDKWNSAADGGPQWLVIDFGQQRKVHRVVIRHEGVMGAFREEARANTADFQVQGANGAEGPWSDLVPPVIGNTASLTVHAFKPTSVRFLRVYITKGTQADTAPARLYEVEAFASAEKSPTRLVFIATDVPPLGYKRFYVTKAGADTVAPSGASAPELRQGEVVVENRFYSVSLARGGIRSIQDKEQRRELLKTDRFLGGEVFTMLSVAPDNRGAGTDAGEFGATPQPVMDGSFDRVARQKPEWELIEAGAVRTVYGLEQPWKNTTVRQRVVIWNTVKRIDCEVDLADFDGSLWREFRMALPLALKAPAIAYEVPMGVVQIGKDEIQTTGGHAYGKLTYSEKCSDIHPRELQNFVDASDEKGGLTLSADVAVFDWQDPTTNAPSDVVLQPILLASRKSCNGEGNWYPQAGDHRYRFSITSHRGGWRKGWRAGVAANYPFETAVGTTTATGGQMPPSLAFLELSATAPNATVCTVKKAEDDDSVVIRLVEMEGRDSRAALDWFRPMRDARSATLIEDVGEPVESRGRTLRVPLGHHAIETVLVRFRPKWNPALLNAPSLPFDRSTDDE